MQLLAPDSELLLCPSLSSFNKICSFFNLLALECSLCLHNGGRCRGADRQADQCASAVLGGFWPAIASLPPSILLSTRWLVLDTETRDLVAIHTDGGEPISVVSFSPG